MKIRHFLTVAITGVGIISLAIAPIAPKAVSQEIISEISPEQSASATHIISGDTPEETFGNLIDAYAEAWSSPDGTLDIEAVRVLYADDPDLVFYDAILPERFENFAEMQQAGEELFADLSSMKLTPAGDLDIRRYDANLAWTTTVITLDAQRIDGTQITFPMRQTAIWQRRGDTWVMVHEHVSAPIGN
ncbi:MAG: nuclear transport factor 2 family protein [Cyanobacteria bacterium P01_F01_bin.150]